MIKLIHNKGFDWYNSNNIWVKGAFFDKANNYYEKEQLLQYFENLVTYDDFVEALKACNGIFSVIIQNAQEIWCASDRCISFPLFYFYSNNNWTVTDDTGVFKAMSGNLQINQFQLDLYKSLGHTFGKETLMDNLFQLQCAQVVKLGQNKAVETEFYHSFSTASFNSKTENLLFTEGVEVFEKAFNRLAKSLNGRTAVVPLSGGYDSRMIAAGLKTQGYENVVCITYGKEQNNQEYQLSKNVAKQLNYKWIFIEHNKALFNEFGKTEEFKSYMNYMSHLSSMFYLQEYFAVKYLFDNKMIPDDSVFIPGHSGDLIGGSQLVKVFDKNLKNKNIPNIFIKKKAYLAPLQKSNKKILKTIIKNKVQDGEGKSPATVFEELDIREKISKVIFNSSLVFDFFGYEKRFPYWDIELLGFFMRLPLELREMKKLYDKILIENYFKPLDINFSKELQPKKQQFIIQDFKKQIKKIIPIKVRLGLLKKADWKNYYEATLPLLNEMKGNGYDFKFRGKSFNEVLVGYYLFNISK